MTPEQWGLLHGGVQGVGFGGQNSSGAPQIDFGALMKGMQQYNIDPSQYFNANNVNSYYNQAQGNLMGAQSGASADARRAAAGMAGSRGMMNPSAFTLNAGQMAAQPYAQQMGNLNVARAGAQQQNMMDLYKALFSQNQGNMQGAFQMAGMNQGAQGTTLNSYTQQLGSERQQEQSQPGFLNYLSALIPGLGMSTNKKTTTGSDGTSTTTGGGSLLAMLLGL